MSTHRRAVAEERCAGEGGSVYRPSSAGIHASAVRCPHSGPSGRSGQTARGHRQVTSATGYSSATAAQGSVRRYARGKDCRFALMHARLGRQPACRHYAHRPGPTCVDKAAVPIKAESGKDSAVPLHGAGFALCRPQV